LNNIGDEFLKFDGANILETLMRTFCLLEEKKITLSRNVFESEIWYAYQHCIKLLIF